MQFCFIFPMVFDCFYAKVYRYYFVRITNKLFNTSRHDALQGPYVLKMTLCVTFGASLSATIFRAWSSPSVAASPHDPPPNRPTPTSTPSPLPDRPWAPPWTPNKAASEGGGAMHMKCPDDIGREAGSGPTRNWNELNEFRARP